MKTLSVCVNSVWKRARLVAQIFNPPYRYLGCGVAALGFLLFAACSGKDPAAQTSSPEASPQADTAPRSPDSSTPPKTTESTAVGQAVAEAEKSLRGGSYEEAATRLLKMRISGARFSEKDAAAYRKALQEAYSRALEAAANGDPRGKAAVEMIRAAGPR